MTSNSRITVTEIIPTHQEGFGGHEFEYQPLDDLFACIHCGGYEVSFRDPDTGAIPPCTGNTTEATNR